WPTSPPATSTPPPASASCACSTASTAPAPRSSWPPTTAASSTPCAGASSSSTAARSCATRRAACTPDGPQARLRHTRDAHQPPPQPVADDRIHGHGRGLAEHGRRRVLRALRRRQRHPALEERDRVRGVHEPRSDACPEGARREQAALEPAGEDGEVHQP